MRLERLSCEDGEVDELARRLRMLIPAAGELATAVEAIVRDVRGQGDEAVLRYTSRFDTAGAPPRELLVPAQELDEALEQMPLDVVAGLQVAIANVASVADAATGPDEVAVTLPQGHTVTLRELPVASAAVYVPGGRAAYPSTVVMGVVTARAAGVLDVAVCTPPASDGQAHLATLGACRLCGVERVYRMGGAQAIAALAYGTELVSPVDVIVGPGNLYVQAAKRAVSEIVGIDGLAGPSDLMVVLGEDADVRLVALDLLAQAEHGAGSMVVAASSSTGALERLAGALEHEVAALDGLDEGVWALEHEGAAPDGLDEGVCALVHASSPQQAVDLANAFAPEHLQLIGESEQALASRVRNAGCLFVGRDAATAFGDYVAGSNHVLPTGGAARFSSTLSPRHFRRVMPVVRSSPEAAAKLARAGAPVALAEGFPLHARSMLARIGENQQR
jgi:histidinol dehydrogenase